MVTKLDFGLQPNVMFDGIFTEDVCGLVLLQWLLISQFPYQSHRKTLHMQQSSSCTALLVVKYVFIECL